MIHSLGNLMAWQPTAQQPVERVREAFDLLFEDFRSHETLFRAVLQVTLLPGQQGPQTRQMADEKQHSRGLRIEILKRALEPLTSHIDARQHERLVQQLSLLFGIESLVVLKDIWGMNLHSAKEFLMANAETFLNEALKSIPVSHRRLL